MQLPYSTALVTGGAGFIGSHLVDALVSRGCSVTVLDNLSSGHLRNLDSVRDRIRFVKGDIRDLETVSGICRHSEVVFHEAAVVSVTRTVNEPLATTLVNDVGTLTVLEAARLSGVQRMVLASSSAVYGDDPELPKREDMAPAPMSPYAVQKLTNEYYARLYCQLYGLKTVSLRYFNVFGPRQDPSSPYSGVISIFMNKAVRRQPPSIYGDGSQTRDFVFVEDVVRANLLASRADVPGSAFNVGTGRSTAVGYLWEIIAGIARCREAARAMPPRPGDILHSLADIGRARHGLGYEPQVSLQAGLEQTLAWYTKEK